MRKLKNRNGVILLFVLWSIIILTALSVSLGRGSQVDMALTKIYLSKLKTHYAAWGGIMYAIGLLQMDKEDNTSSQMDSLYYCGIKSNQESLESVFKDVDLDDSKINIFYQNNESGDSKHNKVLGMQDEERKININALNTQNVFILIELLKELGIEEEAAQIVSYSVLDWKDADKEIIVKDLGAEDEYYERLSPSYLAKNRPFESLEELLLVRGVEEGIYDKVNQYLTVYPKDSANLQINFNTVSKEVLLAMAYSLSGNRTNTDQSQAKSLIDKLIAFRAGADGIEATADDSELDLSKLSLTAEESTIFYAIIQYRSNSSNYFRVNVIAQQNNKPYQARIEAVIARDNKKILHWIRN